MGRWFFSSLHAAAEQPAGDDQRSQADGSHRPEQIDEQVKGRASKNTPRRITMLSKSPRSGISNQNTATGMITVASAVRIK